MSKRLFSQARCEGPAYPEYEDAAKVARQSGRRGVIYDCFTCHDWHVHFEEKP